MFTFPCPSCGEMQEGMRLPRSWTAAEVEKWRALERKMPCSDCAGIPLPDDDL